MRIRAVTIVAAIFLYPLVAAPLAGQLRADAELGGARVSQSRFPTRTAATAQASADYTRRWLTVRGSSAFTMPGSAPVRLRALLTAAAQTAWSRRVGAELALVGNVYDDGVFPAAVGGQVAGRLHSGGAHASFWAGLGSGALDDGANVFPLTSVEAGTTISWRRMFVTGSLALHETRGEPRTEAIAGPEPMAITVRDRVSYSDAVVAPRVVRGPLDIAVRAGARFIHRTIAFEPRRTRTFASIDAVWWLAPHVGLSAGAGRDLADLARGTPDTRYVTVGARVQLRGAGPPGARRPTPREVRGSAPDVLLERREPSGAVLRVLTAATAAHVEVAGTFTDWVPVPLTPGGPGEWTLIAPVPAGPHRLIIRVDGGTWAPPANLPSFEDELGSTVGIFTVP